MQRLFLRYVRPLAPLLCLVVYLGVWLVERSARAAHLMEVLVASIALSVVYLAALRRFPAAAVLRIALPLDTVLVGLLTLTTDRPASVSIAYFWSIAIAAWLLGPRETVVNTVIASVCAALLPFAAGFRLDHVVLVTVVLVLALIGGMIALLSGAVDRAERELARQRDVDAASLRIVERMRATLDPETLLDTMVAALGAETGALRAVARRVTGDHHSHAWTREGAAPYTGNAVTPSLRRVLEVNRLITVELDEATGELRTYMEEMGITRFVATPVVWNGRVIAVFGVHADGPDPWPGRAERIIARISESVAAAIAQSEVHDRAQSLTRLREELVANVSHELRTPLTSTIGFLQTLERTDISLTEGERRKLLSVARREAERLGALVHDLLELSALERGSVRLRRADVEVAAVAREVAQHMPGRVEVEAPAGLTAHADPERLFQILRNLAENGIRHGRGTVHVAAQPRPEGGVRVLVTDGGDGVDEENEEHLFTPFAHWSGRSDSSGLGLAIARRLARAHGGELSYRRRTGDRPHAFVVELP